MKYSVWNNGLVIKFYFYNFFYLNNNKEFSYHIYICVYESVDFYGVNKLYLYILCFIRLIRHINWDNKREVTSMTILRYTIVLIIYSNLNRLIENKIH